MARLVEDHDVEVAFARYEGFRDPRERHDPHGNRVTRLLHETLSFALELVGTDAGALADASDQVKPGHQGSVLRRGRSADLCGPGKVLDQARCNVAQFVLELPELALELMNVNPVAAL